jgi:beta-lactamase class A
MNIIAAAVLAAQIGVAAVDLDTGRTYAIHADQRFPMGSVYKVPIAMSVLRRVDRGELKLDQEITIEPKDFAAGFSPMRDSAHGQAITMTLAAMLDAMVRTSDNTPSDYFVRTIGGPAITADLRKLGIVDMGVDRTETQIGADIHATSTAAFHADPRDTASPRAAVQLLTKLYRREDGLTPASHDRLMEMMTHSKNPKRISKAVPAGAVIAHKTGTMPGVFNDIGIVTTPDGRHHLAIAVLSMNASEEQFLAAVRTAYRKFAP